MPSRPRQAPAERPLVVHQFLGTNRAYDEAALGPQYLRTSRNLIPDRRFRVSRRRGCSNLDAIASTTRIAAMVRFTHWDANRYHYVYRDPSTATSDRLVVDINGGGFAAVGGSPNYAGSNLPADFARYGSRLWCGNGVDPIKEITIGGNASDLATIASFADGSAAPTLTADASARLLTGTYSYCWAIYDHTANLWVERGQARQVTYAVAGQVHFSFPVPTGFASNGGVTNDQFRAHLFLAPINLPVEFGHDHTPDGVNAATPPGIASPAIIRDIIADGPPLPLSGTPRTGRFLTIYRSRLIVAGDFSAANVNRHRWYASNVLLPIREEGAYDPGRFFPVNAIGSIAQPITGVGVVGASGEEDNARGPLAIFGQTSIAMLFGDVLDDPNADYVTIDTTIGCVAHASIVSVAGLGLLFVGLRSVYLLPAGGGTPIDVGWPIYTEIEAVPVARKEFIFAWYANGFYKVCLTPTGQVRNTTEWWLDLRQGIGSVPSWWGPHDGGHPVSSNPFPSRSCVCVSVGEAVTDVEFQANDTTTIGLIERRDVSTSFTENSGANVLHAELETGEITDGAPFDRKLITRLRLWGKAASPTTLTPQVTMDGGLPTTFAPIELEGSSGLQWGGNWGEPWALTRFVEGMVTAPDERPRGVSAAVRLTHDEPVDLTIRDVELCYLPVNRPVREEVPL